MVKRRDLLGTQDIFFHRSMPLEDIIKRRDIAMYPEIKLVERIIFEDEEIIEDRLYSRGRSALVTRFCEDVYFRFEEFLVEFVMKIRPPDRFPVFLGLEIEDIFEELEGESDPEKEKCESRLEIKPDTVLFYRHEFYEKSKFIMHHVEILKRPEDIENKIRIVSRVYPKREKPAIFEGDFSKYRVFGVVIKHSFIVLDNLKVIEGGIELGLKRGVCFLFTRERIKILSTEVVESEDHFLSFKRFPYFIEEIFEDTLSFVVSVIEFDEIILHEYGV